MHEGCLGRVWLFRFPADPVAMKKRKAAKEEAEVLARRLMESSIHMAGTHLDLAKQQAAVARKVMLRFNVRLGRSLRGFTCRSCKTLLVPGVNARVRLGHGKTTVVRITCDSCGHVNRRILRNA